MEEPPFLVGQKVRVHRPGGEIALPAECFRAIDPSPSKIAPPPSHRVHLTILGETASKANSRQLVMVSGHPRFVLSAKAKRWAEQARVQVPIRSPLLTGPLVAWCRCWYASNRPDLDPSLVWDVLQGRVIVNDRQLREMHVYWAKDKLNPRVDVVLEPLSGGL